MGSESAQSLRPLQVALFAHLVSRPEAELDLGQAALMIAEPEYPELDIADYLHDLDQLAASVRSRIEGVSDQTSRASALVQYLLEVEGFRGNLDNYDDPRNSFLNEVLERRLGIPITLAVVMIEVAQRLSIPLCGVSFPGHFLVGIAGRRALLLDPFTGQALGPSQLADLLGRVYGQRRAPRSDELQPAGKHAILIRMLHNLRNIYVQKRDTARQRLAEDRIRVLESALASLGAAAESGQPSRPNIIH
jgi:regulator of sirC expression with transglutaminase-like and TPR domain